MESIFEEKANSEENGILQEILESLGIQNYLDKNID
jgi:hypothetical protein